MKEKEELEICVGVAQAVLFAGTPFRNIFQLLLQNREL